MGAVLLRVVECHPLLGMPAGVGKCAKIPEAFREHHVRPYAEPPIGEALGEAEELLVQVMGRLELPLMESKPPEAQQHGEELWGVAELPAELARAGVGGFHVRRRMPL